GKAMSAAGLFGALGVLTGGSTVLVVGLQGGVHVLGRAERARDPKQVPPKQVPPKQVKEEEWSASPAGPCSPSVPSAPERLPMGSPFASHTMAVDSDGLRLRRRSHTRALRGLRCWLRVQGYRPPV